MASAVSIFVYGSFCEGMVHYNKISKYVVSSQPACLEGSIYRLPVGYPVYLTEGQQKVEGHLLEMEGPDVFFQILDEFHGVSSLKPEKSLYWKTQTTVMTQSGEQRQCFVYALNPAKLPKTASLIENGDWKGSMDADPGVTKQLTVKQTNYINKLGASSGRDIIPIDLELYRELMKLDIIVDKGRRLALTKLGKEVYRFLQ